MFLFHYVAAPGKCIPRFMPLAVVVKVTYWRKVMPLKAYLSQTFLVADCTGDAKTWKLHEILNKF